MSSPEPTPYDTVRYPSYSHGFSHVDRLATQARLFGVAAAPPNSCRVLELGCGNGSNLNPMAYSLPGSTFVGVDYARGPIDEARRMAAEIGLGNVEFVHGDIRDVDASFGMFDYIISHGVYSWVAPDVADRLLAVCGALLAPTGIAFVSYLAYPGSHARQMFREILLYHLQAVDDPAAVQAETRELAAWLASVPDGGDATRAVLLGDARRVLAADPDYLFHDDLTEWNVPQYFVQFVGAATAHGLRFVAEADAIDMAVYELPEDARRRLDVLSSTRIQREQYLDFARARRFRQTLLTRAETHVSDVADVTEVATMYVSSPTPMPAGGVDLSAEVDVRFASPRGSMLETHYPLGKAALELLIELAPERVAFEVLETAARDRLARESMPGDDSPARELQEFLLRLYGAGYVVLHSAASTLVSKLTTHPRVNAVARWQAAQGPYITSLTHIGYTYRDELGLRIVRLLDGTRDRDALAVKLPHDDPAEVDRHLAEIARLGFLER